VAGETARTEAFSDGVFAIAITLLVLELKVPQGSGNGLAREHAAEWPSYVAFLLSFAFIGIMWVNHHRLFTIIRRCDNGLLFLNLLLLLGVTAVPFPTAVLAAYLATAESRTAAALFNGTYLAIAIFFNVLWRYAVSRRLLDTGIDPASSRAISKQYALGPLAYLVCFLAVWISTPASLGLNFALAIFFALPPHRVIRSLKGA
jgi:uncharacterized membrane protein